MIQIIENFSPRCEEVLKSAFDSGFGAWKPNKGEVGSSHYDGMNFVCDHSIMLHALMGHLGKIPLPNLMFCRSTNKDTEKAYVHSDREAGSHTCIVYLSDHEASGTGFYRHRETGLTRMPSMAELRETPEFFEKLKRQMVEGSDKDWELMDFVRGTFGKGLVFDAPLFHSRHPKDGFGDTAETGRVVWVAHYNLMNAQGGIDR